MHFKFLIVNCKNKSIETKTYILAIESSCDDTSAAVISHRKILSNIVSTQEIHKQYGGVVPELASREHQKNIIPTVDAALKKAGISVSDLSAIAFTQGPGLLGSLLVGVSFAKAMALSLDLPLIAVNHMKGHVLAHFIEDSNSNENELQFPFLCLTVSGGHTQIVHVKSPTEMPNIGKTIDDAAGEAFDKIAKIMGLPYPGGPEIDKLAKLGDPRKYKFTKPKVSPYDFSFSGLKTGVLYFLRNQIKEDSDFITNNLEDICASVQYTIVTILLEKFEAAALEYGITQLAIAGGVSANSELRNRLVELGEKNNWEVFIPKFEYTTDNAAMIAIAAEFDFENKIFVSQDVVPKARMS